MNPTTNSETLYEKLGGEPAIKATTELFYKKINADPTLNYFFDGVDMETQKKHMNFFLAYAFGAISSYTGKNMRESHRHLVDEKGLSALHFDTVLGHMEDSLTQLGIADELIDKVREIMESTRDDVLTGS